MRPYFEKMNAFGRELKKGQLKQTAKNREALEAAEAEIQAQVEKVQNAGFPTEKINGACPCQFCCLLIVARSGIIMKTMVHIGIHVGRIFLLMCF